MCIYIYIYIVELLYIYIYIYREREICICIYLCVCPSTCARPAPRTRWYSFIGWSNNNFNNLRFRNSVETRKVLDMGIGQALFFSNLLKRMYLKWQYKLAYQLGRPTHHRSPCDFPLVFIVTCINMWHVLYISLSAAFPARSPRRGSRAAAGATGPLKDMRACELSRRFISTSK